MSIAHREVKDFGETILVVNGSTKSLFNYVFLKDGFSDFNEHSIKSVFSYLQEKGISATWPIESHMFKAKEIFKELGCTHISTPKKSLLSLANYTIIPDLIPDLQLELVSDDDTLNIFDHTTSEIFYHDIGDVITFLKGITSYDVTNSGLKFFLAKINDVVVGTCGMYMENGVAGFYSDGVFLQYRNKKIASQMVLNRIKIAKKHGCKCVVAHCMKSSVNLYKRLGFKVLGNLYLYVSGA